MTKRERTRRGSEGRTNGCLAAQNSVLRRCHPGCCDRPALATHDREMRSRLQHGSTDLDLDELFHWMLATREARFAGHVVDRHGPPLPTCVVPWATVPGP